MTRAGHWNATLARSARPWALLLSCVLLAAQWVLLTHHHEAHADDHAPGHEAAHVCDLCVAFAGSAAAPTSPATLSVPPAVGPVPPAAVVPAFTRAPDGAHRSRAPPSFRSA